ncbi:hypothetical protein N9W67_01230 [Crocinitomicaceae bacterium]|nr:hypothetical protein [Crocinitomicaceae bacterium]
MLKSMTGFGKASGTFQSKKISVEILDFVVREAMTSQFLFLTMEEQHGVQRAT